MLILDFGSGDTCKNDKNQIKEMIDQLSIYDEERKAVIKWQLFKNLSHVQSLDNESFEYAYKYAKDLGFKTTASIFDKESLEFLLKYDVPFIKIACQTNLYDFRKATYAFIKDIPINIPLVVSVEYPDLINELSTPVSLSKKVAKSKKKTTTIKKENYSFNHINSVDADTLDFPVDEEQIEEEIEYQTEYLPMHDIKFLCCIPKYPATKKEYENTFTNNLLLKGISDHTLNLDLYKKFKPDIYERHYILPSQTSLDKAWSITPEELEQIL